MPIGAPCRPGRRRDVEVPAGPNRHPPDVGALILPAWNHRLDQIAGTKAKMHFLPCDVADRNPIFIRPATLPIAVALRGDQQHTPDHRVELVRRESVIVLSTRGCSFRIRTNWLGEPAIAEAVAQSVR